MVVLLYACSVKMWASQGLSFPPENICIWKKEKALAQFLVMDKTIYSDLEVLLVFMPIK